ncbi:MAG: hypothetical protein K2Y05_01840 [Hyphomicrobiaceae bacterium]|nr:hypothetical protein [Hyphomicrobiaceae bacterium]
MSRHRLPFVTVVGIVAVLTATVATANPQVAAQGPSAEATKPASGAQADTPSANSPPATQPAAQLPKPTTVNTITGGGQGPKAIRTLAYGNRGTARTSDTAVVTHPSGRNGCIAGCR